MSNEYRELELFWNADVVAHVRSGKELRRAMLEADICMAERLKRFPRLNVLPEHFYDAKKELELPGYMVMINRYGCPDDEHARRHYTAAVEYAKVGQNIGAIKAIREASNIGLKQAKDHLELEIIPKLALTNHVDYRRP